MQTNSLKIVNSIQPAPENSAKNRIFWDMRVIDAEAKSAELMIYGYIASQSWWNDEVTPKEFNRQLQELGDVDTITVRINSGGGDVFAATSIATMLRDHKAKIINKIDGWAASAASMLVCLDGGTTEIAPSGMFMIHNPSSPLCDYYTADDLTKIAAQLVACKSGIVDAYVKKTSKTSEEISKLMDASTYFTAQDAVDEGFCDKMMFDDDDVTTTAVDKTHIKVNDQIFDISKLKLPKSLINRFEVPPKKPETPETIQNKTEEPLSKGDENMEPKNASELREKYPQLCDEIAAEAAKAERERIKSLEAVALPGFEDIVEKAKFEQPQDAAAIAVAMVKAQKAKGEKFLADSSDDAKDLGTGVATGADPEEEKVDKNKADKRFVAALDAAFGKKGDK